MNLYFYYLFITISKKVCKTILSQNICIFFNIINIGAYVSKVFHLYIQQYI